MPSALIEVDAVRSCIWVLDRIEVIQRHAELPQNGVPQVFELACRNKTHGQCPMPIAQAPTPNYCKASCALFSPTIAQRWTIPGTDSLKGKQDSGLTLQLIQCNGWPMFPFQFSAVMLDPSIP